MPTRKDESIDEKLEDVRDRLSGLNQRVKKYLTYHNNPSQISKSKISPSSLAYHENVSLEDMRNKLRSINEYCKHKLLKDSRVAALAKEIVEESAEPQIEESEEQAEAFLDEKATLGLPQIDKSDQLSAPERLGVGLDLGTAYLVAAREVDGRRVFVKNERNAFLSIRADQATKELLEKLRIKYASLGERMYILGNFALNLANIFNREEQRSMKAGILNPSEAESIPIINLIVQNILWPHREGNEICCFSIPADPIDRAQDTIYHKGVFEGILRSIGFEPIIIDEGYAVVLSELGYKDFTGIGISCGAGMVNVCAAYKSVPTLSFSITRGGDWIDNSAASVLGIPVSKVTTIKEQGMSLKNPKTREEEAIAIYYRNFIRYFLENIAQVFSKRNETPQFNELVDIVFAGGSSMVNNFFDVVMEELQSINLGLPVGNVKIAEEAFTSVSRGCLFHAINSDERNK